MKISDFGIAGRHGWVWMIILPVLILAFSLTVGLGAARSQEEWREDARRECEAAGGRFFAPGAGRYEVLRCEAPDGTTLWER